MKLSALKEAEPIGDWTKIISGSITVLSFHQPFGKSVAVEVMLRA
jgi:hypothetical protein